MIEGKLEDVPKKKKSWVEKLADSKDAYVLGAPVCYLDVNGLTKD